MLAGTTNLRRLDQVEHFWDTVDTIGEGFGFSLFGARHLVTLALYIGFAALSCKLYKAADGLYPRGDGGTAVPDVDVASGGELHVLAFDERAHSACGLSHHAVFGR